MNQWINVWIILGVIVILLALIAAIAQRAARYKPDRSFVIFIGCIGVAGFIYLVLSDTNHILI